jgi:drug/metabolite transporter (DMT)-like permease
MVAAASAVLGWERLDRTRGVALLVALAGMVLVVASGVGAGPGGPQAPDPLGVLLAIGSAVSQTVFVLVVSTSMGLLIAALSGVLSTVWLPFSSPELLVMLLLGGLIGAGIPSFLFLAGVRWIGGVKAGILMLVQAPVGVALAALFLDEGIGTGQLVGGLAILVAAIAIQRSPSVPATAATEVPAAAA